MAQSMLPSCRVMSWGSYASWHPWAPSVLRDSRGIIIIIIVSYRIVCIGQGKVEDVWMHVVRVVCGLGYPLLGSLKDSRRRLRDEGTGRTGVQVMRERHRRLRHASC